MDKIFNRLLFMVIVAAGLYYYPENYWRSVWWDKWFVLMAGSVALLGFTVLRLYHWSAALFLTVALMGSLWAFGWRNAYPHVDLTTLVAIGKTTAYTFSSILLLVFILMRCRDPEYKTIQAAVAFLCFVNSIVIVYQWVTGVPPEATGGIFGNPSISGCFIGMGYAYLCLQPRQKLKYPSFIAYGKRAAYLTLPVLAVFLTASSQPVGVLLVAVVSWYFCRVVKRRELTSQLPKFLLVMVLVIGGGLGVLALRSGLNNEMFSSTGRVGIWKLAFEWWREYGHVWTGQGTGVSQIFLPTIQRMQFDPEHLPSVVDWWLWFHSDWLQLLFENGVIGFFSGVVMYIHALVFSFRKADWLFSAVCAAGAAAVFNFPAHFPLHAFAGLSCLVMAFDKNYLANGSDVGKALATLGESNDEI